jgi:hypothetical protein
MVRDGAEQGDEAGERLPEHPAEMGSSGTPRFRAVALRSFIGRVRRITRVSEH